MPSPTRPSSSAASCWARSASTRPRATPFVWITQSLEAKHYANTQASFTYTHDSWEEITRERDRLFPDLDIVGWYHTHPSFGIFLSHHDLFIHQHFFAQPLQVAYVVDPIQQTRGFFQWRGGDMAQVEGFYLTADRGDRIALARLANDLENLPNPQEHGGGALSPRLEAELIKMLTRPSAPAYAASAVDRFQIAAVFGMLGSMLGVLGVAAGLWLYQLHGRIQEQADAIKALAGSVDQVDKRPASWPSTPCSNAPVPTTRPVSSSVTTRRPGPATRHGTQIDGSADRSTRPWRPHQGPGDPDRQAHGRTR